MSKPHKSLSVTTNLLLIPAWAAAAALFAFIVSWSWASPLPLVFTGVVLGVLGGIMQRLSFNQASARFSAASTLLDVRHTLKTTLWGWRYLRFLYVSKIILGALAFLLSRGTPIVVIAGYLAGYFSLMCARELVTLPITFRLQKLAASVSEGESSAG